MRIFVFFIHTHFDNNSSSSTNMIRCAKIDVILFVLFELIKIFAQILSCFSFIFRSCPLLRTNNYLKITSEIKRRKQLMRVRTRTTPLLLLLLLLLLLWQMLSRTEYVWCAIQYHFLRNAMIYCIMSQTADCHNQVSAPCHVISNSTNNFCKLLRNLWIKIFN